MFILLVTYTAPLDEIDALLPKHLEWLKAHKEDGVFLAGGRKVPRDGGVILASAATRQEAESIAASDPFVRAGIATTEVIEFAPSFLADGLEALGG